MTTPTPSPHSPGPWKRHGHQILDATGGIVCDLPFHPREDADARLIINAPETARLLRDLVGAIAELPDAMMDANPSGPGPDSNYIDAAVDHFTPLLTQIQKLEESSQ